MTHKTLLSFNSSLCSGAHLNPAVTLSLCFLGRHPWTKFPFYVFSQLLGAFLAAATVSLLYYGESQSSGATVSLIQFDQGPLPAGAQRRHCGNGDCSTSK